MRRQAIIGCACLTSLLAIAAVAGPIQRRVPSNSKPRDEPATAFGATIIDIAFTVDDAARQSLVAEPTTDAQARMSFADATGARKTYDVKVHLKGGTGSRRSIGSKPAFKVDLAKGDRFFGLEHLTLNNMVQDPTMVREALAYQVYEAAGAKAASTGYARLAVDGEDYGLYLNLETPDTRFLKRVFGDDTGILYEGSYGVDLRVDDAERFELHAGSDPDRATLKTLIHALDVPGDGLFYGTSPLIDTRAFLATMAADALLGNWDSYYTSNNYRLYWSPSAGRWFLIPSGLDQTFSSTTVFGATGLLFQKCLASERCTADYAAAVRDVSVRFESLGLLVKMDALLSVIDPTAQADPKKKYDAKAMTKARLAMRAFIARRPEEVRAALACMGDPAIGACAGALLVNESVEQCAQVAAEAPASDTTVVSVSTCLGTAAQRWRPVAQGDAFRLTSVKTGNCLDLQDPSSTTRPRVLQRACTGAESELLLLRPVAKGTQLVSKHSHMCVAVAPDTDTGSGAALTLGTCADVDAQLWHLRPSLYR